MAGIFPAIPRIGLYINCKSKSLQLENKTVTNGVLDHVKFSNLLILVHFPRYAIYLEIEILSST